MPKTRTEKEAILAETGDRLKRSSAVVFVKVTGVKVNQVEAIRDGLFPHGLQLQVAKNTLLKRVLTEQQIEVPAEMLDQPIGVIYGYDDVVAPAKATTPFTKEFEALEVVGGLVDGAFITPAQVQALALLPGREQLLAQLVGTLAAPLSGMVNVLAGNLRGLVNVLSAVRDAKQA